VSIRLLIVDDQELVRTGFRLFLETQDDLEVVGEAGDGAEAIERARELRPDVVLMDIRMTGMDGIEATARLTAAGIEPPPRVLVLTTFDLDEYVFGALRAGASGFLLKDAPPRAPARGDPGRSRRRSAALAVDHSPADRGLRRPHRPGRAADSAARAVDAPRARGARSRRARTLERRDRGATGRDRGDCQEPRRQHPDEARPARQGAGCRLRLRARHCRRRAIPVEPRPSRAAGACRYCSPPESFAGRCASRWPRPTRCKSFRACRLRSPFGVPV
jgi:CheY-like chemotaxis protein